MCGFIGLVGVDIKKFQEKENRLTTVLRHRGPDNVSVYVERERRITLIHNRLSIIGLNKSANQPMKIKTVAMSLFLTAKSIIIQR